MLLRSRGLLPHRMYLCSRWLQLLHLSCLRSRGLLLHRMCLRFPRIQLLHLPCLCSLIQILPRLLQSFYGQLPSCLCLMQILCLKMPPGPQDCRLCRRRVSRLLRKQRRKFRLPAHR